VEVASGMLGPGTWGGPLASMPPDSNAPIGVSQAGSPWPPRVGRGVDQSFFFPGASELFPGP